MGNEIPDLDVNLGFEDERYLSLETYRRSGERVATPVWFAGEAGVLYVRTFLRTAKVGRVAYNPEVRVAPCDKTGNLRGAWITARARIVGGTEESRGERLLNRKYGLKKRLADAWYHRMLGESMIIVIEV